MYPLWEKVVAPIVAAAGARRIVEIGALRGENTIKLLHDLGAEAEIHVIDPLPEFDAGALEQRFPGRYVFHRDLSLNVLADCGAFDLALVDGDHNWYTVYNELRVLRESARAAGEPLPVLILHDVSWPYGRRDLYYAPEQIPAEFRQPFAPRGMRPDRSQLLPSGGMNASLHNADHEGGPRNGVMTALDDFVAEHDRPLRRVVLPLYFGLAVAVEEERLERRPQLREMLDHLESAKGKDELIELLERIRVDAAIWEQNLLRYRDGQLERSARRYLDLLKGALLDEHYIENEARIEYLLGCIERARPVNPDLLRDPKRHLHADTARLEQARKMGHATEEDRLAAYFPYTAVGRAHIEQLEQALQTVRREGVAGDLVECGTGRGGGAIFLRGFLQAYELEAHRVWVADRFRAAPDDRPARPIDEGGIADLLADLHQVREGFDRFGLFDESVRFLQGGYGATLPDAPIESVALLRVGCVNGEDAGTILEALYDRVAVGGFVFVENIGDAAVQGAVDTFRRRRSIVEPTERVGWSGAMWRKAAPTVRTASPELAAVRDRAPLAPAAPSDAIDLSVVVVFYNMRREAERTLQSLSRAYQEGIGDLDYEVIVVDNGSNDDQRLDEDFVRSFGPEFRLLDIGAEATPSPTPALNRAISIGRGRAFALMVDGAHVLSPGVLRYGMAGLRTYAPAVVATQQWYIGPGQQPDVVPAGYDQTYEDELFRRIEWPSDGYGLFRIGHFIGERDWLDGLLESNCLFVPRALLEQVGGFDDSFSMPGAGYANLELWERLGSSPDVTVVTILGEGSFHQVHGGTTTNVAEHDDRRGKVFSYSEHYQALRGRTLRGPAKAIHYVGALRAEGTRRSRARRMTAEAFVSAPVTTGPDGLPEIPTLMPEELKRSFVESFFNGLAWQTTTWLGSEVTQTPTDLLVYQELIATVRPDWIIETGTGSGGRALFLASVCELIGNGHVVSIAAKPADDLPRHPRISYVRERPHSDAGSARVREVVGDTSHALVVLGSRTGFFSTVQEFERYSPYVGVGSYVIVEDTIVNGHPVWPGFGPGPGEAVNQILTTHGEFVQDTSVERYGLTFNPGGFLKRMS
jgi:cephalosporin hydroxylase